MLLLLNTVVLANLPITATADPGTEIEVVSIYTEPEERAHWDVLKAAFESDTVENPTGITLKLSPVEMDDMFDEIIERHLLGTDADVIFMHAMWLPSFAHYEDPIVTSAPPDVALDVETNFVGAAKEAVKYKGVVYGIPTEFNSHALVYNHKIIKDKIDSLPTGDDRTFLEGVLTKLNVTKVPLTYSELKRAARLLTVWTAGRISSPGFMPYIDGNEEKRYEFMNLLWSNNGEFLDLTGDPYIGTMPKRLPEALFNSPAGLDALMLFNDLSTLTCAEPKTSYASYDPEVLPDIYWTGWYEERIAMVIIPGWFTYVRDAMGARFSNVGVAPVPVGPQPGAETTSVTYAWMMAVTQRAEIAGRAAAAWTFLDWLNKERTTVKIDAPLPIGPIPKGTPCSIMGDWLITDSTMPGRINDQLYGWVSDGGVPTKPMREDHWFKGFMDQSVNYGRADKAFLKGEQVQDKVGFMFELVASYGENPATALATAADEVNDILPIPGDINMDGKVGVADAQLVILDYGATPAVPAIWNRGRSDVNDDNLVDIEDAGIIVINWT